MGTTIFAQPQRSPELLMRFSERLLVCVEGKVDCAILEAFFHEHKSKQLISFLTPLELEAGFIDESFAYLAPDSNAEKSAPLSNGHEGVYRTVARWSPRDKRVFGLIDGDDLFKTNDPRFWSVDPESIESIELFEVEYWRCSHDVSSKNPPVYYIPRHEIENFLVELKVLRALVHKRLRLNAPELGSVQQRRDSNATENRWLETLERDLFSICERVLLIATLNDAIVNEKRRHPQWKGAEISFSFGCPDKGRRILLENLSKQLEKEFSSQRTILEKEWEESLEKWAQLLEYDAEKQTMNLDRFLRYFDGKAIFSQVHKSSHFDLNFRSEDECHIKSVWADVVKTHHSKDVPYAPAVLVRMLNHFLKALGEPSLHELYVRSLSGGRAT